MYKLFQRWAVMALFLAPVAFAQHPKPQPRPGPSAQTLSADGITTFVVTPQGLLPPGQNQLAYVESNNLTGSGIELPNTLPSTPTVPFNLIGAVSVFDIDKTSPRDDLQQVLQSVRSAANNGYLDLANVKFGLNILEGNPINRAYTGFALLHYTGPEKVRRVTPIFDASGVKVGGNINIHQIWFDNHIESDTGLLDPTDVQDVTWTVTYTVDVLNGGADDFAPNVMYFDDPPSNTPGAFGAPNVSMDTTFSPAMNDGKRFVFQVKMAPGKYYNLTYHWGWRIHPPRVQVTENALKKVGGKSLVEWETGVFGAAPRSSDDAKMAAIAQIGELAPEKRMWQDLRSSLTATPAQIVALMDDALLSFNDWSDRTHLPRGVPPDPGADTTLFFVNNTIYGNATTFPKWVSRGTVFTATLLNGDHFVHSYMNVDFGGARGWENQFQNSGGAGSSHTFGRMHWWINAGGPWGLINIPSVDANGNPGLHKVNLTLNFDPSGRLKLYQFDPLHHDTAIFSLH